MISFRDLVLPLWRRRPLWLWLALLTLAIALTALVAADLAPDEAGVVREVQGWGVPGQRLSDAVRAVTSTEFVVVVGIAIVAVHWLAGDRRAAVIFVILLLVFPVTQAGIKELVDRPRPSEEVAGIEARAAQTSPSFPAGHVMGPTAVYGWAIVVLLGGRRRGPNPEVANGATVGLDWMRRSRADDAEVEDTSATVEGGPGFGGERAGQVDGAEVEDTSATAGAWRASWRLARVGAVCALLGVLALTGVVSVWLGVHWPTDVLGGYLWGGAILLPAIAVYELAASSRM